MPTFGAPASYPGSYGRRGRAGIHRPVYTIYEKYRARSPLLLWKR